MIKIIILQNEKETKVFCYNLVVYLTILSQQIFVQQIWAGFVLIDFPHLENQSVQY